MIVRKVVPSIAVGTVVLSHRAPGALAEVGPPALPMSLAIAGFDKPDLFIRHRRNLVGAARKRLHVPSVNGVSETAVIIATSSRRSKGREGRFTVRAPPGASAVFF